MVRTVAAFGLQTLEELRAVGLERPRAVIFDWDNTLIESWQAILDAQNYTLAAFGLEPWTLEETRARVRGSMRESFPALLGARWREAGELFYRRFTERHMQTLQPLPGATSVLEELHGSGLYLAVVSNKKGDYLRKEAAHLGWDRYFGRVVGAFDAARDKLAADPVHLALEGSGIRAGSGVWFAGDADIDLECAVNAHCTPVLLRKTAPGPGEFDRHPPVIHVDSCLELSELLRNLPPFQCSPSDQETELKIIGAELTKCLPPELLALLQRENVETICIQHDKAVDFPFELCWLDQGGFFLGDRIAICRWFIGTRNIPRIRHAPISSVALLKGKSKASNVAVQMLSDTFPRCAIFNTAKDVVENVLKTTQYDIIHFIGHCMKDEDGQAALELEYGKLNLIRIGQLREESEFGKREPFVTLSGCSTTAPFIALLEHDTFAHRFVEARACGFLGNLWPVDGRVANAFSHHFYHGLVSGRTVGQALMDAKRNLIDGVEDTDWGPELNPVAVQVAARSYSLFANPDLRLKFNLV